MIFIVGPHDAGKTTIANFLCPHGFLHVETSAIVKQRYQEQAPTEDFGKWAEKQNHYFDKYIAQAVVGAEQAIKKSNGTYLDVLVTGNRQIAGIDYLTRKVPTLPGRKNLILYVEADEETLFRRHVSRPDRAIPGLTLQRFKDEILAYDQKMGVEEIKPRADLVICNCGDLNSCFNSTTQFLESKGYRFPNYTVEGNLLRGKEF